MSNETVTDRGARNAELLRDGYGAFATGDMAALKELFAPTSSGTRRGSGPSVGTTRAGRSLRSSSPTAWSSPKTRSE
jgi:ketosteroid isomerase-like protein